MKRRDWDLAWGDSEHWPPENPNVTTFLAKYADEDESSAAFSRLKRFFRRRFEVTAPQEVTTQKTPEPSLLVVKLRKRRVCLATVADDTIAIRALSPTASRRTSDFLTPEKTIFTGLLPHREETFSVGHKAKAKITTTIIEDETSPVLFPQTICQLKTKQTLIGKANISYYNGEMGDCSPTMELFEIRRGYRGKGLGKGFLMAIEDFLGLHGFTRIWATDASSNRSSNFWDRMGYSDMDGMGEEFLKSFTDERTP